MSALAREFSSQRRSQMIIRSGLIKNKDTVDFDEFTKHWRDVHGPLARIVPRMRAYSQNHIKRTILDCETRGVHRVDGISQLRFDTVADMAVGVELARAARLHCRYQGLPEQRDPIDPRRRRASGGLAIQPPPAASSCTSSKETVARSKTFKKTLTAMMTLDRRKLPHQSRHQSGFSRSTRRSPPGSS